MGSSNDEYGTPQVLGSKVYVPDESNGTLKVYDTEEAAITKPVKVTGKPGELSLFVRDGLLWVNDADNATAVVINSSGHVNRVHKYDTEVPSGRKPKKNDHPSDEGSRDPPGPDVPNPLPEGPSGPGRDTPLRARTLPRRSRATATSPANPHRSPRTPSHRGRTRTSPRSRSRPESRRWNPVLAPSASPFPPPPE